MMPAIIEDPTVVQGARFSEVLPKGDHDAL
jgi:hypothetical protein